MGRRVASVVASLILFLVGAARFADAAPDDPLFLDGGAWGQWNLMGSPHPDLPAAGVRGIDAEGAWAVTRGRPDVAIAVLDSGVRMDHPDLAANVFLNLEECAAVAVVDTNGDGVLTLAEAGGQLGDLDGDGAVTPLDVLLGCENGLDDDGNGYVDDVVGWDFEDDDNDPTDLYGHGTGRAGIAAAVADNGIGMAGVCPSCRILPVRIGRTFVAAPDKLAEAIAYAADRGAAATVMATGSLGNSGALRSAVEYAEALGVVQCAAIGNERSRHHHFPQVYEPVLAVAGVVYEPRDVPEDWGTRWQGSNYGAHVDLAAPTFVWATNLDGTWSEEGGTSSSVPHCAAAAGLVVSRSRDLDLTFSAGQIRSVLRGTAGTGVGSFSPYVGAGRIDAAAAVGAVDAGAIPPEARIVSPRWYEVMPPGPVEISIDVEPSATATLEMGYGIAPTRWEPVSGATAYPQPPPPMAPLEDSLGDSYAVTFRLSAEDGGGNLATDRRTVFVHADPDSRAGFPLDLGASAEGSPALADLDGDNRLEIVLATSDGRVHAIRHDGSAVPGWPVSMGPSSGIHPDAPAHAGGQVPVCCTAVFAGVAAGDLDGDGLPEVVAAGLDGRLYAWQGDGSPRAGFPRELGAPIWAAPVLVDLDGDGRLDVVAATYARQVFVMDGDGADLTGWPVTISDPTADAAFPGLIATPAAGDLDGDGRPELVVATTESEKISLFAAGRVYAFRHDGTPMDGFPVAPFGLMNETFPVVGSGVASAPILADLDGDGRPEILAFHAAGQITAYRHDGSMAVAFDHGELVGGLSPNGPDPDQADPRWELNLALLSQAVGVDLSNDGVPEVLLPTMALEEVDLATLAADPGEALASLTSVLSVWRADGSLRLPFPRALEGWALFASTTVADLDSDTLPEVLVGSDGGWLHAWNARGEEAPGFPKFAGGWLGPVAAVGDLDGDGLLDVVTATRQGWLSAWSTGGAACVNGRNAAPWPAFHHDTRNSGDPATDAIPPAAVSDARVEDGSIVFTAVGGDGLAGRADRYDARWSTGPIEDEAAFAAATPVEYNGAPQVGGTVRAGSGIPAGAYAAAIAWDEAGNRSPLPASGAALVPDPPCLTAPVIRLDPEKRSGCACQLTGSATPPGAGTILALAIATLLTAVARRARLASGKSLILREDTQRLDPSA